MAALCIEFIDHQCVNTWSTSSTSWSICLRSTWWTVSSKTSQYYRSWPIETPRRPSCASRTCLRSPRVFTEPSITSIVLSKTERATCCRQFLSASRPQQPPHWAPPPTCESDTNEEKEKVHHLYIAVATANFLLRLLFVPPMTSFMSCNVASPHSFFPAMRFHCIASLKWRELTH